MTAEPDVLVATEHVRAAPEVVFCYLTDPALLGAWLCESAVADAVPGGALRLAMGEVEVHGRYLAVEPPHRVVFTWGVPGWEDLPPGSSTVEVVLTPDGPGTLVVLTHRGLPDGRRAGHAAGWAERLAGLGAAQP